MVSSRDVLVCDERVGTISGPSVRMHLVLLRHRVRDLLRDLSPSVSIIYSGEALAARSAFIGCAHADAESGI